MTVAANAPVFGLLLQPEFPINALILTTEALRICNQNSGRELFCWQLVSGDGEDVRASNGMWLSVSGALDELHAPDYLVVFEGNLPTQKNSPAVLARLRECYRAGATLVGVDTGGFALTQSGLATDAVVVHWEAASTYQERFARLPIADRLYRIDGRIISCAGGVAVLDLMLALIGRHYGESLAAEVANALVHQPRAGWQAQRAAAPTLNDGRGFADKLIGLMEQHLDFPLSAPQLAARLSVSLSTLERHCRRQFGSPPMQVYLGLRLQAARNFLFYEDYNIKDVALAYGFSSTSVFSRTFKAYFGQTPSAFRDSVRSKQVGTRLPEVRRLSVARREHQDS